MVHLLLLAGFNGVEMGSALETFPANAFFSYYEKNWLNNCPRLKLVFDRLYLDDIFILFKSNDHLKCFQYLLNSCHINMPFFMEIDNRNKLSCLAAEVICKEGKFTTIVYQKSTFSGICSNLESFLLSFYKFGMVYTLVYGRFCICLNWIQFHAELTFLKGIIFYWHMF